MSTYSDHLRLCRWRRVIADETFRLECLASFGRVALCGENPEEKSTLLWCRFDAALARIPGPLAEV